MEDRWERLGQPQDEDSVSQVTGIGVLGHSIVAEHLLEDTEVGHDVIWVTDYNVGVGSSNVD